MLEKNRRNITSTSRIRRICQEISSKKNISIDNSNSKRLFKKQLKFKPTDYQKIFSSTTEKSHKTPKSSFKTKMDKLFEEKRSSRGDFFDREQRTNTTSSKLSILRKSREIQNLMENFSLNDVISV